MSIGEIHDMAKEWAAAAKRAVEVAGFDGVEIHGKYNGQYKRYGHG